MPTPVEWKRGVGTAWSLDGLASSEAMTEHRPPVVNSGVCACAGYVC
ncbi:MAG: hypothetical protein ACSHX8_13485 [Opitutaceae bacterium]